MAKSVQQRVYAEDRERLRQLSIDLSSLQRTKVSATETVRRILKIPNLKDVLSKDAEIKRNRGILK